MKATVIVALSLALFGCFVSIAKGAVDDNLPMFIGGIIRTPLFILAIVFVAIGM